MKPKEFWQIYEQLFSPMTGRELRILELGVQDGSSLRYWKMMFPGSQIIGVDTDPNCKNHEEERIKVLHYDQTDIRIQEEAPFDIIIDDGGHKMSQQKESFKNLFPCLRVGGYYIIEDLETSYWSDFIDERPTMVDFLKSLVDSLNYASIASPRSENDKKEYPHYVLESVTFYPNLCVVRNAL